MTKPKDPWEYNQQRRLHLLVKSAPSTHPHLPRKQKKTYTQWGRKFRQQLMAEAFLTLDKDVW